MFIDFFLFNSFSLGRRLLTLESKTLSTLTERRWYGSDRSQGGFKLVTDKAQLLALAQNLKQDFPYSTVVSGH